MRITRTSWVTRRPPDSVWAPYAQGAPAGRLILRAESPPSFLLMFSVTQRLFVRRAQVRIRDAHPSRGTCLSSALLRRRGAGRASHLHSSPRPIARTTMALPACVNVRHGVVEVDPVPLRLRVRHPLDVDLVQPGTRRAPRRSVSNGYCA